MIPIAPAVTAYLVLICMVVAIGTGALTGVIVSLALRLSMQGVWKDALLGLLGFLVVFGALAFSSQLRAFVSSDEGPLKAGLIAATALPLAREFSRFVRKYATPD